jgi:hypothetical protein
MNKEIKEKESQKKEFAERVLASWIGKLISSIVYHLLWRVFTKSKPKEGVK